MQFPHRHLVVDNQVEVVALEVDERLLVAAPSRHPRGRTPGSGDRTLAA
jgi:hypothetical protein